MRNLIYFLLLIAPTILTAQEPQQGTPFNGLITDLDGNGIKAQIAVKNSEKSTIADKDGKFGLTDIAAKDTLIVKYKKETMEIPVEGRRSIKILWAAGQPTCSEEQDLVDHGYGYVTRREYTGSSTGLSGDMLRERGFTNLQTAILTLVPGALMINGELTLRGPSSINSSNAALIILNDIAIPGLGQVDINDVKSIEIQKGSNMYGLRGTNGVIIIRTK